MPFPANAFELFVASPEGIILLQLAVAHLLGDFAFQTDRAVRNKQQLHLIAHFWHGILHFAVQLAVCEVQRAVMNRVNHLWRWAPLFSVAGQGGRGAAT